MSQLACAAPHLYQAQKLHVQITQRTITKEAVGTIIPAVTTDDIFYRQVLLSTTDAGKILKVTESIEHF